MSNTIHSIQVVGAGCPNCARLFELTKQAASDLNLGVEVEYISDIVRMMSMGVMSTPILAVNDQVVMAGQVPDLDKIKELLTGAAKGASLETHSCGCCSHC